MAQQQKSGSSPKATTGAAAAGHRHRSGVSAARPRRRINNSAQVDDLNPLGRAPHGAAAAEKLRVVLRFLAQFDRPQRAFQSGLVGAVAGQLLNLLEPYLSKLDAGLLEAFLVWLAGSLERCANQDISVEDLDAWLRGELDDTASREIESVQRLRRQLAQETE